jgi:hypothetical protein
MTCAALGCQCALLPPVAVSLAVSLKAASRYRSIAIALEGLTVRYHGSPCITDLAI